eukprot:COSAG01_NODE_26254_length_719_cov_12.769355_1_plen_97_part_00
MEMGFLLSECELQAILLIYVTYRAAVAPAVPTTAAPPASQVAGMVTRWSRRGEPPAASFLFDRGEAADVACKKSAVLTDMTLTVNLEAHIDTIPYP